MSKYLLIIIIFLYGNILASGGSPYSRYGIGDIYHYSSALQLSTGGIGVSLNSQKHLNFSNPASIFKLSNTKFNASLTSNTTILDDGSENAIYSQVRFTGFNIGFPIKEDLGMAFMLGLKPYSIVNYSIIDKINVGTDDEAEEAFEGSGGFSKIYFGMSYLLPFDIAIGATFDYYTGNVKYQSSYNDLASSGFINSQFTNDYKYKGLGATIGLLTPDLSEYLGIEGITDLRLGAVYEMSGPINTDTSIVVLTSIGENTFESDRFHTEIPGKFDLGINFIINNNYLLVLDYIYQPWSKFEHNGLNSKDLRDLSRYSIGIEIGDQTKRFATFWELIKLRGGLSYEQSQYQIRGTGIDQIGFHLGISFPLGLENTIDIGAMYGMRGTTDSNLLKENIIKASVSLNFGELWFVRREW
jgi:hypothetical protein